ncbi:MAG: YggT family protein [Ghiorsea sp.]|nr:YggT family protein [Ghiorsea sp.]
MFIIGYLLQAISVVLGIALNIIMIVVIARAVLSWVSPDPYNPIVRMINQISEPILFPIRRRVPYMGGVDWSPIIALMIVYFLDIFLVQTLNRLGMSFI